MTEEWGRAKGIGIFWGEKIICANAFEGKIIAIDTSVITVHVKDLMDNERIKNKP
ncbi:hypothetical protein [Bartonella bacilliformis]|uniref:hypothetical protein n=1 Tax=Bartonella bacilliformis TaxID=774 RepID=UPI000A485688|nr:hypothetical protein [Bartonella bacilliformis]